MSTAYFLHPDCPLDDHPDRKQIQLKGERAISLIPWGA